MKLLSFKKKNTQFWSHMFEVLYTSKKMNPELPELFDFVMPNVFVLIHGWVLYFYNFVFSTWCFFSCLLSTLIFTWLSSSFSQLLFYFYLKSKFCVDFLCHIADPSYWLFLSVSVFLLWVLDSDIFINHKFSSGTLFRSFWVQ